MLSELYLTKIGSHCSMPKDKLQESLTLIRKMPAAQVFLSPPMKFYAIRMCEEVKELIRKTAATTPMFCHAPYYLNLCNPYKNRRSGEKGSWVVKKVKEELSVSGSLGFRGVVIHVGKSLKETTETADRLFRRFTKRCLKASSPDCPLLVETPAGQGTELYTKVGDFAKMFKSLEKYAISSKRRHQMSVGICVDTCHVFASGYDPFEYITRLEKLIGKNKIRLIHMNNSKGEKGSRVDRHNHIVLSDGKIEDSSLIQVATWAIKNSVCMVTE